MRASQCLEMIGQIRRVEECHSVGLVDLAAAFGVRASGVGVCHNQQSI